jgi:hypothetical protein
MDYGYCKLLLVCLLLLIFQLFAIGMQSHSASERVVQQNPSGILQQLPAVKRVMLTRE